jgi:hypothetical protein
LALSGRQNDPVKLILLGSLFAFHQGGVLIPLPATTTNANAGQDDDY